MFKHICLVRKDHKDDGTWNYELDSYMVVDWDAFAAEKTLARLQDRKMANEYHVIQTEFNWLMMRNTYVENIEGVLVYNSAMAIPRGEMEVFVRITPVNELRQHMMQYKLS